MHEIMATATVSIAIGPVKRIDRDNILQASLWGMRMAYRGLGVAAGAALIDGNIVPKRFPCPAHPIIGGDGAVALGGRGVDRRQGDARPDDGEAVAPLSALWLG